MRRALDQSRAGHPDEAALLLFLDAELEPRAAAAIALHLHGCEECGVRVRTLQHGMHAFLEFRQAVLLPEAGAAPKGWREFSGLLRRVSNTDGPRRRPKAS